MLKVTWKLYLEILKKKKHLYFCRRKRGDEKIFVQNDLPVRKDQHTQIVCKLFEFI